MLIINYYVKRKPIESVLYLANISKEEYKERIEKLINLGVDFSVIDDSLMNTNGSGYQQLNEFDLEIFKRFTEGQKIKDVASELNKSIPDIRAIVRKFKKYGITFGSVIEEQRKAEEEKATKQQQAIAERIERARKKEALEAARQQDRIEKAKKIETARQARMQKAAEEKAAAEKAKQEKKLARIQAQEEAKKEAAKVFRRAKTQKINERRKRAKELSKVLMQIEEESKKNGTNDVVPEIKGISKEKIDGRSPESREQTAVVAYMLKTHTQAEIAKILGLSKQTISQIAKDIKGLNIYVSKKKEETAKPNSIDLKILQMIQNGYTNSEIEKKMNISDDRLKMGIDILRKNGHKFRVNPEKPAFKLDAIYKLIIQKKLSGKYYGLKDLEELTGLSKPAISRRIRVLRNKGLIPENRYGKMIRKTTAQKAVQKLIDGPGVPKDAINKIADYYGVDPSFAGKVAEYIDKSAEKEKE